MRSTTCRNLIHTQKQFFFSFIIFLSRFLFPSFLIYFVVPCFFVCCFVHLSLNTVLDIKTNVSWSVKPYWLENSYCRFGKSGCLHLHSRAAQEVCLSLFIVRVIGNISRYYVGKCREKKGALSHYCVSKSYTGTKSTTFRDPTLQLMLLSSMCFGTK